MMDIPAATLDELKCSSCELYLSRGPVYLQHDGAAVCGRCYTPKRPATRNTQFEATAKLLRFPCKNRDLGCPETVPFVEEREDIAHEEVCQHRQYVCPVLGSGRCDWLGTRAAMLAHCRDQHPDRVLENPCTLTHDIARASLDTYIITAFQLLFLLHTKVCLATGKIFHAIRLLGCADEATNYHFTLDIKRDNQSLSKPGNVALQGCLAIQEPTSLTLDTNSLLSMFDGFDGTTFTVTVKRRVSDVVDQLVRAAEKCGRCKAEVTALVYRDGSGWRCKSCVPAKQACRYQGCTYTDFSIKCWKHATYFCQQRTECNVCNTSVSRGSLAAHYTSAHQDVTHRAGSTWRAARTGMYGMHGRHCLVSSAAGTAVCWYVLNDTRFDLYVCIPLLSEQLKEFRCTVRVTDPATGHERTFTPDVVYNQYYDWYIEINKDEFPSWNVVFDVSVDIAKI